jgi:hypothetical protein|tara:strand:+ start:542 stop:649 length:108 start_codon:yes stop_codon:yes gene_type:complete
MVDRDFMYKLKNEEKECVDLWNAYPEVYSDGYRRI